MDLNLDLKLICPDLWNSKFIECVVLSGHDPSICVASHTHKTWQEITFEDPASSIIMQQHAWCIMHPNHPFEKLFMMHPLDVEFEIHNMGWSNTFTVCKYESEPLTVCIRFYNYTRNPNDPCFEWKWPSFGGFKPENRGQTVSRYTCIYIYVYRYHI